MPLVDVAPRGAGVPLAVERVALLALLVAGIGILDVAVGLVAEEAFVKDSMTTPSAQSNRVGG
jgi:hypothetical protein